MQKNMLLNLVGMAALSLLCACGPAEVKHEVKADDKRAEAEIPTPETAEVVMQVAEADVAVQPAAEVQQVAEVEAQEQKA